MRYEFEIHANEALTSLVARSPWVDEGFGSTSWEVWVLLEDGESYYWRARASDEQVSAWTSTARFLVILDDDDEGGKEIVEWSDVNAASSEIEIVTVTDTDSALAGTSIEIPVGALAEDCTVMISEVNNPPALPGDVAGLGVPVDFGPDGLLFSQPVTIRIPYSQAQLDAAGVSDPRDLSVWTYNSSEGKWEEIAVDSVDTVDMVLVCSITHFSMYQAAAPVKANGGGGGGGGCFVETVRE